MPGGAAVGVRVRPRSRPGLELAGDVLVVRVAAAPVDGRATEEARRSLAAALRVPPSAVALRSGATARAKVFGVDGLGANEVLRRLRAAGVGSSEAPPGEDGG